VEKITSRKHPLAAHLKKLGTDSTARYERGEFLCDGIKLLREAVASNCVVTAALTSRDSALPTALPNFPTYVASPEVMEYVSPLKSAQDIIFACKMPELSVPISTEQCVVLDGVQDPGNVGTVLRTAAAFGIDRVLLVGNCADAYNPKTVRATMGAIFRQPVTRVTLEELAALELNLFGAALGADAQPITELNLRGASVAIGSEGRGLSDAVLELCRARVVIPMRQGTESLNAAAAAAILMWEIRK
jgi:TrmH family RNA methyltransferase